MTDSDLRALTQANLVTLLNSTLQGVRYLLTNAERHSQLIGAPLHVITHELALEFSGVGAMYFTWAEEPTLNGHPIRLSVSDQSSYQSDSDLEWTDARNTACWKVAMHHVADQVRTFEEEASYEAVSPPSTVITGVEVAFGGQIIQITVIAPPDDTATPLSDWTWSPSTVVTIGCGEPDLSRRPGVVVSVLR